MPRRMHGTGIRQRNVATLNRVTQTSFNVPLDTKYLLVIFFATNLPVSSEKNKIKTGETTAKMYDKSLGKYMSKSDTTQEAPCYAELYHLGDSMQWSDKRRLKSMESS